MPSPTLQLWLDDYAIPCPDEPEDGLLDKHVNELTEQDFKVSWLHAFDAHDDDDRLRCGRSDEETTKRATKYNDNEKLIVGLPCHALVVAHLPSSGRPVSCESVHPITYNGFPIGFLPTLA